MNNNDNEPLFTLSPEEVEIVMRALITERSILRDMTCKFPGADYLIIPTRIKINELIDRIRKWEDEDYRTD